MLLLYSKGTILGVTKRMPTERKKKKRYRRAHMLPVRRRMSGIHRMFESPRALSLWRRRYQVTLEQL